MADGSVEIEITADDSDVKKKFDDVGDAAKEAAGGVNKLADSTDDAEKGLRIVDVEAGNLVANGLTSLVGKLGESVSALFELAESTREYREDMAKLDTAFTTTGHTTETARQAYSDFYAILGESDRSVEAVNHLAELTNNEQEVAQWSTIAAGVTAKFGDSLPIEGLTEAANETAKVGQVTGPLADALNWAGISEDEFNRQLAACNSEQERATLITSTLSSEYQAAADEYNELTASTQAARRATDAMEQAQANLGTAIEPVTTAWTQLKTKGLQAITPIVETLAGKFMDLLKWLQENPAAAATLIGVLTGVATALGIVTAALIAQTVAQWAKNAAELASPTTWIIIAVVAAIAALVAAFLYMWNNSEAFRNFFIGMWEGIKTALAAVGEFFVNVFNAAWEGIKAAWAWCVDFFTGLWDGIVSVFSVVGSWFANIFSAAWNGIKNIWSAVTGFFSGIWNGIVAVFSVVGGWFRNIFTAAWNGIKSVWSGVTSFFNNIWTNIKNVFKNAKDNFLTIGKNIVDGIKQGISKAWNNLVSWLKGLFGDLIGIAKKILGIHSPSKEFAYIAEMIVAGLQQGLERNKDVPGKSLHKVFDEMQEVVDKRAAEQVETIADYNAEYQKEVEEHNKAISKLNADFAKDKAKKGANIAEITEKYNEEVEKENDRHAESLAKIEDKISDTIDSKMKNIISLEKEYNDNITKLWTDLEKSITDLQKKYDDQLASRTESIANSLNLWDKVSKDKVKGTDLTKNLKSQVEMLEDYNTAIASLEGRNVNADFIAALKEQGVGSTAEIEAIAKMSDSQLAEYVGLWEKKQSYSHHAAVEELEPLKEETEKQIDEQTAKALDKYTEYRTEFAEESALLMTDLKNAITEAGGAGYEEILTYIDDYTTAGKDLMDGVITGIANMSPLVSDAVSRAVNRAIEAAKAAAGIHSPSTVMRDEVGKQLGAGFIEGWHNKIAAIKRAMTADVQGITASVRATVGAENARYGYNAGAADTGMSDLTRAVGIQTAGINSLAGQYRRGAGNMRPIIIQLDKRELGRAVVDVSSAEQIRAGIAIGGVR